MSEFLPPVVAVLTGEIGEFKAKMAEARGIMAETSAAGGGTFAKFSAVSKFAMLGVAGAAVVGGIAAVKMAADFQEGMTTLVTGAGESQKNIKMVGDGILAMSGQVGTSAEELTKGMYMVESAGFHGAAGLDVLRAAAEGAKVGNADMGATANAITSALNAYGLKGKDAASVTNQLIATVASGKMHMDELATSLGTVVPTAAALHVPLSQVGAAIATMTATGIDAHVATTNLRFSMLALAAPTSAMKKAMADVGLESANVGKTMASGDYVGALKMITDAAGKKFPVGSAAYIGAVKEMVGGTRGMQAVLALTGKHLETVHKNQEEIAKSAHEAGGGIKGWDEVQKDFNVQVAQVVETVKAFVIQIGQQLIPYVQKAGQMFIQGAQWIMQHKEAMGALAALIGGVVIAGVVALTVALWGMTTALLANPITWIVVGLMALGAAIVWAYNNVDWFKNGINAAFSFIKGTVVPLIATAFNGLKTVFTTLVSVGKSAWTGLQNGLAALGNWIKGWTAPLVAWWHAHWTQIQTVFAVVMAAIKIVATVVFANIKTVIQAAMIVIGIVIKVALDIIKGVWTVAWSLMVATLSVIWNGIVTVVEVVLAVVSGVIKAVTAAIHGDWSGAWQAIVDTFSTVFHTVVDHALIIIDDLKSGIGGAVSGFITMLYSAGSDLIQGLINGIQSMIGNVLSTIAGVGSSIASAIKGALGIASPSRVTHEVGKNVMEGLIKGMVDSTSKAVKAAKDAVLKIKDAIKQDMGQIRDNFNSAAGITVGAQDGVNIVQSFARRVAKAREFAADIQKLQKMGLNATSLREIIAAGPESGHEIAQQLLATGAQGVAQTNRLEKQLMGYAGQVGAVDVQASGLNRQLSLATDKFDKAVAMFARVVAMRNYYTVHHVLPKGWTVDDHNHLRYTAPAARPTPLSSLHHTSTTHVHVHLNAKEIQRQVIKQTNQYKVRNGATRLT